MPTKLYRCADPECATEFEAEPKGAACPECGAVEPTELVPVHYLVPDKAGPIRTAIGRRLIACDPTNKKLPQSSGERQAVSCPKCKASAVFVRHEADGVDNHDRFIEKQLAREHGGGA